MAPALVLCALALAASPAAPPSPALPLRRFALIAGVNDGGSDRVPLRYARSDAEHVARVLERLGGLARDDELLLLDVDDAGLRAAFRTMDARIRAAHPTHRAELVLYYSGHADAQGLLLRGTHLPYPELRRWLASVDAQVRIAIVDSCSSGALTRAKGGQRAPPFLVDTSSSVKGHAILTSSAADEASQESDRIGASFFTHFLVTGLRGAADANLDGKVTVSEAYQFAFAETLARTERTGSGAQHPTYDIQLAGSGDVVVTDLRGTDATLVFPEAAAGRFFVRDRGGQLVAELRKLTGRPVELGVDSGVYRVVRDDGRHLGEAQLTIAPGGRATVPVDGLTPVRRELAAVRGGALDHVPVDLSVFPPLSLNSDKQTLNAFQLGMLGARTTRLRGFGVAPALWAEEDVAGAQLGGVWASAGLRADGAQVSGVLAYAGALRGAQVAGVGAVTRGHVEGTQIAGIAGLARSITGVQLSGVLNVADADVVGLQLGGVASWGAGRTVGLQLSGVANVGGTIEGGQLSTVNVADEVHGGQLAIVNVAAGTVHGGQLGIVNVARRVDGLPLGLVNVVRDGWRRFLVVSDESGTPTIGYAGGDGIFHTTLEASVRRTAGGARGWAAFGPGLHLGGGPLTADLDLLAGHAVDDRRSYAVVTLRALAVLSLSRRFALVAGPTANVLLERAAGSAPPVGGGFGKLTGSGERAPAWIGVQAGLRL